MTESSTSATSSRDPDLTRSRILNAALSLFVDKGFADVAMREIAERSGVTKSLIHHHFGSKDALWQATKAQALEQYAGQQREALEGAASADAELLRDGVVKYFRFLQAHPEVVRLMAWTHMEGDTECAEVDATLVRLGAERVTQAQEAGIFRDDVNPVHVVTLFILACTQWFQARAHHSQWPGMGDDDAFLDDFLKIYMSGLEPPAP